jgi:hypothetical protein
LEDFMSIWNILWTFGKFYDHSVHFVFIWYIFPVLVSCTMKNLATLVGRNSAPTQRALDFFSRRHAKRFQNLGRNFIPRGELCHLGFKTLCSPLHSS